MTVLFFMSLGLRTDLRYLRRDKIKVLKRREQYSKIRKEEGNDEEKKNMVTKCSDGINS